MRRPNMYCLIGTCLLATSRQSPAETAADQPAKQILQTSNVKGGLVVHLGCGDGKLTAALRANDSYLVHGLDADAANVGKARTHIQSLGLCGKVAVERWTGDRLPYVDNLASLVVVSKDEGRVSREEILRVLAPGGVALTPEGRGQKSEVSGERVAIGGRSWVRVVKPWPKDVDEWTHFLHDASGNAVAKDARVGPPRHMQWLAAPEWARYHHMLASISAVVSTDGRIFYIMDEGTAGSMNVPARWFLVARDAFNGVFLWRRPISSWAWYRRGFRSGPVQLPRTLVAKGNRVYAPLGLEAPMTALDAATGGTVMTYDGTERTEEVLLHEGVLLVVTGSPRAEQAERPVRRRRRKGEKKPKTPPFDNEKAILAIRADTGEALWKWSEGEVGNLMPLTLAAAGKRVFFQDGKDVLCLNLDTGAQVWRSAPAQAGKGKRPRGPGWSVATLVVQGEVVLWADGGRLSALSAETGKQLWECKSSPGFKSPVDVFVAGGLVWTGPQFSAGRDLHTGEIKKSNTTVGDLWTAGHHHRCYREKATERYIMTGKRGIEFLDLVSSNHSRNNWIRGVCQYGVMPCNGLVYAPSHACGCYMEAKLYGFWALAAGGQRSEVRGQKSEVGLERGPAYGQIADRKSQIQNPVEWPTYRHDALRSGSTVADVPARLGGAWQADVGGRLSAPVVAGGIAVVSSVDEHRVVALDVQSGKVRWAFTTGGRVDSPPTLYRGLALFGCADGWVYCLRASDGEEVWRFRAAPEERRTVALDRVESVWPVHGSVLVQDGVAYVAAGRSSYLDEGIFLYGLDPQTGKVLSTARVRSQHPKLGDGLRGEGGAEVAPQRIAQNTADSKSLLAPDKSDSFSMAGGATTDVLVSDGTSIYLRQVKFDRKLVRQPAGGRHLLSTSRLLDDSENHRSHWVLGTGDFSRIPVAYSWIANPGGVRWGTRLAVPYGLMLAFDSQNVWRIRRRGGYVIYADPNKPFSSDEEPLPDFRKPSEKEKAPTSRWSVSLAMRPRAMLRAGEFLFVGGMPNATNQEELPQVFEGRRGGLLCVVSMKDTRGVAEYKLPSPPVWDGMAAAKGRLYIGMMNGQLACMAFDKTAHLLPKTTTVASVRGAPGRPGAPVVPDADGKLVLKPETAKTTGSLRYQPNRNNLGAWVRPNDYCAWNLERVKAGTYAAEFSYGSTNPGVDYTIVAGSQQLAGKTQHTGGIKTYKAHRIGTIALPGGKVTLAIKPGKFRGAIMNFRLLTLTPVK